MNSLNLALEQPHLQPAWVPDFILSLPPEGPELANPDTAESSSWSGKVLKNVQFYSLLGLGTHKKSIMLPNYDKGVTGFRL